MISIGLPAIKPQFLAQAMQSVLDQTYADFELIVFNDRADEQVREVAGRFSDRRIRYEEGTAALPVVANWNRVLSLAQGEYFVLFSDDDRYAPGYLMEMSKLIDKYPSCAIFHCRVRKTDESGKPVADTKLCPEFETGPDFILHRMRGDREQFAPEFIVKTRQLRAIGGFVDLPLAWGTDDLTWFQLALSGGVAYHPEPLVEWRQSPLQISQSGDMTLRMQALIQKSILLGAMLEHVNPADDREKRLLAEIKSLKGTFEEREKEYLVAINARNTSFAGHFAFFIRNRRQFRLKFRWLAYSCYLKLNKANF